MNCCASSQATASIAACVGLAPLPRRLHYTDRIRSSSSPEPGCRRVTVALCDSLLALLHDLANGGVTRLAVDRDGMQLPDTPADHGNPQQLTLQDPHLPREDHPHRDRFPG